MYIADVVFIAMISIFVLDMLLMAVYCRVQKRIDHRNARKKASDPESGPGLRTVPAKSKRRRLYSKVYQASYIYIYGLMRYSTIVVGRIPSQLVRRVLYKWVFNMQLSKETVIQGGCEIRSPWNIKIGNSIIGVSCILDGRNGITIEDDVVLGNGVHIWTEEHNVNDENFATTEEGCQPVYIEKRSWICSDSTILPGVRIGAGCVVASRGCVTKDCDAFMIYGGVPAKKIGERNHNLTYHINKKCSWKFY